MAGSTGPEPITKVNFEFDTITIRPDLCDFEPETDEYNLVFQFFALPGSYQPWSTPAETELWPPIYPGGTLEVTQGVPTTLCVDIETFEFPKFGVIREKTINKCPDYTFDVPGYLLAVRAYVYKGSVLEGPFDGVASPYAVFNYQSEKILREPMLKFFNMADPETPWKWETVDFILTGTIRTLDIAQTGHGVDLGMLESARN